MVLSSHEYCRRQVVAVPGYERWVDVLVKITVPVAFLAWSLLLVNGDFRTSIYALPGVIGLLFAALYWTRDHDGQGN